jgi:hypothetical protein
MHGLKATGKYIKNEIKADHVLVWEAAYGSVPDGYEVHHINGIRNDNRLCNLEIHTCQDHHRIHSPNYKKVKEAWQKLCPDCGTFLSLDMFYLGNRKGTNTPYVAHYCKKHSKKRAIERARRKRHDSLLKK